MFLCCFLDKICDILTLHADRKGFVSDLTHEKDMKEQPSWHCHRLRMLCSVRQEWPAGRWPPKQHALKKQWKTVARRCSLTIWRQT